MTSDSAPTDGSLPGRGARRCAGAGLSTELTDIGEVEYRQVRLERVVLIGVWTSGSAAQADRSMQELARLAETGGSGGARCPVQRRSTPDAGTYVGSGKARELAELVRGARRDTLICDGELTPGQLSQLEKGGEGQGRRPDLADPGHLRPARAAAEGKTQVELAQLQYMLPRLRGWGEAMSRQAATGGGIGALRGPGETKLETDRRRIHPDGPPPAAVNDHEPRAPAAAERERTGTPAVAIVATPTQGSRRC